MPATKKLVILDTSAIIHRAYHALPPLTDKQGNPVGAVYGLTSILIKVFKDLKPDMIVAALDLPEPSFRKTIDPEYQAKRKEADEDLKVQFKIAEETLDKFNITKLSKETFEADDIIGTISEKANQNNQIETIIVTGDLDICQLVNEQTQVMMMKRGITNTLMYDVEEFRKRFPFEPMNLTDYKGLRGDSSDNIKGVPRVGEKAAMVILEKFKEIDELYKALESMPKDKQDTKDFLEKFGIKVPNFQLKALREHKDFAYLSKKLATIIRDVEIDFDWKNLEIKQKINQEELIERLNDLGFNSIVNRLETIKEYFSAGSGPIDLFNQDNFNQPPPNPLLTKDGGDRSTDRDPKDKFEFEKNNNYHLVTPKNFSKFIKEFENAEYYALDTEGTELNPMMTEIIGLSFCFKEEKAYYVPVVVEDRKIVGIAEELPPPNPLLKKEGELSPPLKKEWERVKKLLLDSTKKIIGHNIKYDYKVLSQHGLTLPDPYFDTMLAAYLTETEINRFTLDNLALKKLGHEMIPISDLIGKKKDGSMKDAPLEKVSPYACEDADYTWRLFELYSEKSSLKPAQKTTHAPEDGAQTSLFSQNATDAWFQSLKPLKGLVLKTDTKTQAVFHEIEMPLIPVLARMEMTGVNIDQDALESTGEKLQKIINEAKKEIFKLAEEEFNINSTKDLQRILFEKLAISSVGVKRTSTGKISTAAGELERLRTFEAHPIIDHILTYRECTKLLSTYVKGLIKEINPRTKRIHTDYLQHGAITGRLSSSNPNLQNIPTRSAKGEEIKKAFVAGIPLDPPYKGGDKKSSSLLNSSSPPSQGGSGVISSNVLIKADYSQIELRIAAHISEDPVMTKAFIEGRDFHTATAAMIFKTNHEEVTKNQRRIAKTINFGILYGQSAYGLSQQLGIGRNEAQNYIDRYFDRFAGLKFYIQQLIKKAERQGYVETLFGRRRYIKGINTNQYRQKAQAERVAVNTPFQGTNADIIKLAMISIDKLLRKDSEETRYKIQKSNKKQITKKTAINKSLATSYQLPATLLMQVHDELVLECPKENVNEISEMVKEEMEGVIELRVPLVVDVEVGDNWLETSSIDN